MNARTTGEAEVIVSDENDVLPIFNQCFNNGVIPTEERLSKDVLMNENGQHLVNFCKLTGYVMLNGRFGRDQDVSEYTCINTRGRSVVDYILCRPVYFPYLTDFEIMPPSIHSDHFPLRLNVKFNYTPHVDIRNTGNVRERRLKWDPCKKQEFINMWDIQIHPWTLIIW